MKQNDQKQGKQHGQGQQYGCHWLEKRRNTKRKPLKNNVKHKNEQRQKKALCQGCECHGIHSFESSSMTCNKFVPNF
jgi:hypothetical protein